MAEGMSFDPLGFVGNIFDTIFNSNSADRRAQQQRDDAMFFAQNRLQMTVQDGAKAGLSPLASIGASANISPATLVGPATSNMGQSSSRLTVGDRDPLDEKLKRAQIQLIESQAASNRSDAIGKAAIASRSAVENAPGTPAPSGAASVPLPRSRSDVLKPLYQDYDDGHGGIIQSFSEPASQSFQNWGSLPAQIAAAAGLAGGNLAKFQTWLRSHRSGRGPYTTGRYAPRSDAPASKYYSPF